MNLKHLNLWDSLISHCASQALELGREMQAYYDYCNLEEELGCAFPDTFGRVNRRNRAKPVIQKKMLGSAGSGGSSKLKLIKVLTTKKLAKMKTGLSLRFVVTPSKTGGGVLPLTVSPCEKKQSSQRLDDILPLPYPKNANKSQLWNEKSFIHCIRMIAIAIEETYEQAVEVACETSAGQFRATAIKGFGRMANKCISKDDHAHQAYPRPSQNVDINRSACTFDSPEDLLSFIDVVKAHPHFGGQPVRSKNMHLYDEATARKQFHYRTVMINWLYSPGMTFKEMATKAHDKWQRYLHFTDAPGFGVKDASESWSSWRAQIEQALAYLTNPQIGDYPVQFIVETQLLLSVYLQGRIKMHLLYKVCRAANPQALCNDFKRDPSTEDRSYEQVQRDALKDVQDFIDRTEDVNRQCADNKGATRLWEDAENGHEDAVRALLAHPQIDPNKPRLSSNTTPLYIAAHRGHTGVVEVLLRHPRIRVNQGAMNNGISPLYMAVQQGREEVVEVLLRHKDIKVLPPISFVRSFSF
jgi:hypothetical protein